MSWIIFYPGGTRFSSDDGDIQNAPARGVLAIVQDNPEHVSEIVTGADFYAWWDGRWRGLAHIYDLWDYAIETGLLDSDQLPSAIYPLMDDLIERGWVKIGRMVTQGEYDQATKNANLTKTGWLPYERRPTRQNCRR